MAQVTPKLNEVDFLNGLRLKRKARKTTNCSLNSSFMQNENPPATFLQKPTNDGLSNSKSVLGSIEFPQKIFNQIYTTTEKTQAERLLELQQVKQVFCNNYGTNKLNVFSTPVNNGLLFPSRLRFGPVSVLNRKTSHSLGTESSTLSQRSEFGWRKLENNTPDIGRNILDKKMSDSLLRIPATIGFPNSGRTVVRQREGKNAIDSPVILPSVSLLKQNCKMFATPIITDEEGCNDCGDLSCGTRLLRKRKSDSAGNPKEKVRVISRKIEKTQVKIGVDEANNTSSNVLKKVGCDNSGDVKRVVNKNYDKPFNAKTMNGQLKTLTDGQTKVGKAIEVSGTSEESETQLKFVAQELKPSPVSQSTLVQHLPNIDFIDGFEFLSFEEEDHLRQFERRNARNGRRRINGALRTRESAIALSKTHDVTKIKGWRQKCFKSESITESKNTFGNPFPSNFSQKISFADLRKFTCIKKVKGFEDCGKIDFKDRNITRKFAKNSKGNESIRRPISEVVDLDLVVSEEKLTEDFNNCINEDSSDDDGCSPNEEIILKVKIETMKAENSPKSAFMSNYLEDFLINKSALSSLGAKLKTEKPPSKFIWPTQAAAPKIKPPPFRMNTDKGNKISILLPHARDTDSKERPELLSFSNSQRRDEADAAETTLKAKPLTVIISRAAAEFALTALKLFKPTQTMSTLRIQQENTASVAQVGDEISPPSPYSADLAASINDGEAVGKCLQRSCLLGCLCETLKSATRIERGHCGKSRCMFKCLCKTGKKVKKDVTVRQKRQTRLPTRLKDSFVWKNDENLGLDMDYDQPEKDRVNWKVPVGSPKEDKPVVHQVNSVEISRANLQQTLSKQFVENKAGGGCKNEENCTYNLRKLNGKRSAELTRESKFISKTAERGPRDCKDDKRQRWKSLKLLDEQSTKSAKMRDLILHLKRLNYLIKPMMREGKNKDLSIKDAKPLLVDLAAQSIKRLQQSEMNMLQAKRILMNRRNNLWDRIINAQIKGINVEKQKAIAKDLSRRLQFVCKGIGRNGMNEDKKNWLSQTSVTRSFTNADREIVLEDIVSEAEFENYLSVIVNGSDEDSDEPSVLIENDLTDEREAKNSLRIIPSSNVPTLFGTANFQRSRITSSNNAVQQPESHTMTNVYPSTGQRKSLTPARLKNPFNVTNFKRTKENDGANSSTYSDNPLNLNNFKGSEKTVGACSKTDSKPLPNYFGRTWPGPETLLVPMVNTSRILVPIRVWPYVSQNGMHMKKLIVSKHQREKAWKRLVCN